MTTRLIRIHGRHPASRRARLDATRHWMEARGWSFVDYAESTRQALFEREGVSLQEGLAALRPPPGWASGLLEELREPRTLVVLGVAVVAFAVLVGMLGRLGVPPGPAEDPEAGRWRIVDASTLNVREEPNGRAQVTGILKQDERVLIGAPRDGWIEVIKPYRGFVAARYLKTPPQATGPGDKE